MSEINDKLMVPCAQCCRKHLSAAIAHYVDSNKPGGIMQYHGVLMARALINLCEAAEGYESHRIFAVGLLVKAEQECVDTVKRNAIRDFRLAVCDGKLDDVPMCVYPSEIEWYQAHVIEAERELPEIREAVHRRPFYRGAGVDASQPEPDHRLAQLKRLDENSFGLEPSEKGREKMACKKAAPKAAAKKAACKGGCTKKCSCKKGK